MKEITCPTKIAVGDLIIIPSEKGKTRKRLHLNSVNAYARHGLSIGFTSRSRNEERPIQNLLMRDDGKPTVLYVRTALEKFYISGALRKYEHLLGADATTHKGDTDTTPEVKEVQLTLLPMPGVENEWTAIRHFIDGARSKMTQLLQKHLVKKHFVISRSDNNDDGDNALSDAFNSSSSWIPCEDDETSAAGQLSHFLYETYVSKDEENQPPNNISAFSANFYGVSAFRASEFRSKALDITATPKFLMFLKKNGARFLRPDEAFHETIRNYCASRLLLKFAESQVYVMRRINMFLSKLKEGVERTKWRGKSLTAESRKTNPHKAEFDKIRKALGL